MRPPPQRLRSSRPAFADLPAQDCRSMPLHFHDRSLTEHGLAVFRIVKTFSRRQRRFS